MTNNEIRLGLIAKANQVHLNSPQYKGHFDNYSLAVAIVNIKNKYREIIVPKNDYVIVNVRTKEKPTTGPYTNSTFICAVIGKFQIDTLIRLKHIKILE